jgi:hypothetical protein
VPDDPRGRLAAIADAAARWTDADFPPRVRVAARLAGGDGYACGDVDYALDRLFGALTPAALAGLVENELGSLSILERFVPRAGAEVAALPVGEVLVVGSRTTIGVTLFPALCALLAGNSVTVKERSDLLASEFFATLAQEDPALASRARAEHWAGHGDPRAAEALARADAVVAFGRPETLALLRAAARPEARFIPFGPRASFGYLTREALASAALTRALASAAARALLLYDTEGCMSLHGLFVERGASVAVDDFLALLANELAAATRGSGRGKHARAIAAFARGAAFRAAQNGSSVYADEAAGYALARGSLERPPEFAPCALEVLEAGGPEELTGYVRRHAIPLEALAFGALPERRDVEAAALAAGAARLTELAALQAPRFEAPHGGRPRLAEFVRLIAKDSPR